jgi:hypothetical protein
MIEDGSDQTIIVSGERFIDFLALFMFVGCVLISVIFQWCRQDRFGQIYRMQHLTSFLSATVC